MPQAKPRRRPPLSRSLPFFLPSLIAVFLAIWIPPAWERYSLLLLLIGASLSMAAVCHAIGFGCGRTFARMILRRGPPHLIALAIHTAIVFLLVAWPLMVLSQAPSLAAALGLAAALVIALLVLWRFWPVFGLVFAWDDAFPAGEEHSWITAALARSLAFACHLTRGRDLFLTHFLPASLAQLVIAFGALTLAGIGANLPDEIRTASLFLFAVLVLPVCSLIVADRTLRLLFDGRVRSVTPEPPTPPTPRRERDVDATPAVEMDIASAPVAEPAVERPAEPVQAVLDENLLVAARAGNTGAAMEWLAQGANPDALPPAGARDQRSALVLAAELPDTHLLRALIAKGADVNRAHAGLTPLLATTRACREGRPEMVTSLIANGADPARADVDGNTPLHHAALCVEPAVAAILIDAQAPLEARNREQATPLAVAAAAANWPALRFLAEHGAHADSALPAAAGIADDDPEGVRILLKHKGRANAVDALGRSALLHAARENHVEITRVLLDANADVALADRYGTTPLMEAARAGAAGVVALLAEKNPDVNACDQHGRTALMLACQSPRANAACVRVLLELGADPNRKGSDGRSAIDQASAAGRWDLVALMNPDAALPASHARGNEPDPGADTPQHLLDALRFAHWSVVARFEERVRTWPATELAALYLDLADHADAAPRAWLLEHGLFEQGLDAEARLDDGSRLFDVLLDHLPASIAAVRQLLDAGAAPAGAGRFGPALARLDDDEGATLALAMLERGADAFGADADQRTPLHHASRPGMLPVLRALLARGADPNARDRAGATPLHVALDGKPDEVLPLVKALIAHGADPESPAASGETPLGLALARDATKLEHWLRWNGWALPKRPLRDEDLPVAAADPDAVARLLELGLPVDARDSRGATVLLRASGAGALQSVQRLLAAHADPKLTVDTGASPLSAAVSARQPDIARALIAAGVPVDLRHADDVTALMIAAALGHPDMVAVLRELGAQIGLTDARSQTALHAAARFCFDSRDSLRCRRLLDALLNSPAEGRPPSLAREAGEGGTTRGEGGGVRGAEADTALVNTVDRSGATPLLVLLGVHVKPGADCDGTHLGALVPAMLDAGANLDHADEHGVTALHACAMHATFEPARVLLQRGANREARDCMQRTPSDVARVLGYVDLAMELAPRRGVPLNAPVVTPVMTHQE